MVSQIVGKGQVLAGRAPAGETPCSTVSSRHSTTCPSSPEISSDSKHDANIA